MFFVVRSHPEVLWYGKPVSQFETFFYIFDLGLYLLHIDVLLGGLTGYTILALVLLLHDKPPVILNPVLLLDILQICRSAQNPHQLGTNLVLLVAIEPLPLLQDLTLL